MSTGDLIDDDADVSAAVGKILARGPEALGDAPEREDVRENRTDREPHEQAEDADMDAERAERDEPVEAQTEEETFFEIPGDTEDAEPVKIPLSEAAEAVKQFRQMQGDVATAVIKAETEAQAKQDEITTAKLTEFQQLRTAAATAYQLMQQFLPQQPDRTLLDERSQYYNPQEYYAQKAYYDEFSQHAGRIRATIEQADQGVKATQGEQEKALVDREMSRAARYIPEFKEEASRTAKQTAITEALAQRYGITKEDMDSTVDHRFWRMANDLAGYISKDAKAPEVRKAVQERAAKIVGGKLPPRDQGTGRFMGEAAKAHREQKSEDSFARKLLASGALRNF